MNGGILFHKHFDHDKNFRTLFPNVKLKTYRKEGSKLKPNFFVKHVGHEELYHRCVLPEFQDVFTFDIFVKSFPFMLENMPSHMMSGHHIKQMIKARYVEELTVEECLVKCGVTRGKYYYWSNKGIEAFSNYFSSLLLTSPLTIVLLAYRIQHPECQYIKELYRASIKKHIGIGEFLFSAYGNIPKLRKPKLKVHYEDGSRPDYATLLDDDPNFLRSDEYDKFADFLIDYLESADGEWVVHTVKLFEKGKPFYNELVQILEKRSIPRISKLK